LNILLLLVAAAEVVALLVMVVVERVLVDLEPELDSVLPLELAIR
jgi:hypothetical protein